MVALISTQGQVMLATYNHTYIYSQKKMSKILCILCILFNLWAAPIICWYFRELKRVARSMQPVCRQRRSKLQKSLKYLSSYIINDNLYSYLSCISYIINDKLSYSKSRNYATPPDENEDEVLHNQWLFVLQKRFWCFLKSGNCAVFCRFTTNYYSSFKLHI